MEIQITNLEKRYGNKVVFSHLDLRIDKGDFVALLGESGCGKTTLLNIIGLLDDDYTGSVMYDGVKVKSNKQKRSLLRNEIAYVFQNYGLVDNETVYYNLSIPFTVKKLKKKHRLVKIDEVLEKVGLSGFGARKIYELSGGEQQRVALAKVFLKNPALILADEPTASLDSKNGKIVMDLLTQLNQQGATLIIVTHSKEIASFAHRRIEMGKFSFDSR